MPATREEKKLAGDFADTLLKQACAAGYHTVTISICLKGSHVLATSAQPGEELSTAMRALKLSVDKVIKDAGIKMSPLDHVYNRTVDVTHGHD